MSMEEYMAQYPVLWHDMSMSKIYAFDSCNLDVFFATKHTVKLTIQLSHTR